MSSDLIEARMRSAVNDAVRDLPLAYLEGPRRHGSDRATVYLIEATSDIHQGGSAPGVRRRGRRPFVIAGVAAATIAAVAGLTLTPTNSSNSPTIAAAAQLRTIADLASEQTGPQLQAGQFLLTKEKVAFNVQLGPPHADATLVESTSLWSNGEGGSCLQASVGPPQFSSAADQAAWQALGSSNVPAAPAYCSLGSGSGANTVEDGDGAINVASLPTDPTVLATELETGTTGVPAVDELTPGQTQTSGFNAGFERAVILLVGPTTGGPATFRATVFRAMASIPQVVALGPMTSHEGLTGMGFEGTSSLSALNDRPDAKTVVIVDPDSGELLEAQNVVSSDALRGEGPESLFTLMPSLPSLGTGNDFTVEWVDPVGSPAVVNSDSLPQGASISGSSPG
jgi:hypothetical protein